MFIWYINYTSKNPKNETFKTPFFQHKIMQLEEPKKIEEEKTSWIKTKPAELEKIIKELAEQGNSPAKIGLILRDKHGIPKAKLLGKKITKILKDSNTKYVSDKEIVNDSIEKLKVHIGKNKHDYTASHSLSKKLWLSYRLNKA